MKSKKAFKSTSQITKDVEHFELSERIDEDTEFARPTHPSGSLVFNFSNVTSINSLGVRTWVNFLRTLKGYKIALEQCPPHIVRQMIMTPSFTLGAEVLSVYVPYACENCAAKKTVLVLKKDWGFQGDKVPEKIPCDKCKQEDMEFEGEPRQYFSFSK